MSLPDTTRGDVTLVVGSYMLPEVFPELKDTCAKDAEVVHSHPDAYEIAKSHRVEVVAVCDPKRSPEALAKTLTARMTDADKRQAAARHRRGAKSVTCNNGSYRLLQLNTGAHCGEPGRGRHPLRAHGRQVRPVTG